jgi:F-type H+-transporting ATPase subunit epsilon
MIQQFKFDLVSPEAKILSENVTMAVIPAEEGDIGVLSGHAPLIATVRTGVVEVYRDNMNDKSTRIFIAGGFADISGESCTVLAEQAINVNDIDKADIEKQIVQAEENLNLAEEEADRRRFQKRIDILRAMAQSVS